MKNNVIDGLSWPYSWIILFQSFIIREKKCQFEIENYMGVMKFRENKTKDQGWQVKYILQFTRIIVNVQYNFELNCYPWMELIKNESEEWKKI